MDLIPSFQLDHTKITAGIYVSRVDALGDETVTTFDIRMKLPNLESAVSPKAMHTIEHIIATFLRNDKVWKDNIVYFGPMGCLTGCYLIIKGKPTPKEIYPLVLNAFKYCAGFNGEIPGAKPDECGNYLFHDLPEAKREAELFVKAITDNPCFEYPKQN